MWSCILLRMWKEKKSAEETLAAEQAGGGTEIIIKQKKLTDSMVFLVALGVITGAICSLSGAGGPVLVMPLLVVFGVSARAAVGVALFDSVFIAVPACAGYLSRIDWKAAFGVLTLIVATHGVGVWMGSRVASRVPVRALKLFVGIFSVGLSIYMLVF